MASEARLRELGFSDGLIAHLGHFVLSSPLGYRCQPPFHFKSSPISQRPIDALWESSTTLVYFNRESHHFEVCSLESIDEVWYQFATVQAVLAHMFIELLEDELDDDALRAAAKLAGFRDIERLLAEGEANQGARYNHWRESFPNTCLSE